MPLYQSTLNLYIFNNMLLEAEYVHSGVLGIIEANNYNILSNPESNNDNSNDFVNVTSYSIQITTNV
jgi:hypothetical protein